MKFPVFTSKSSPTKAVQYWKIIVENGTFKEWLDRIPEDRELEAAYYFYDRWIRQNEELNCPLNIIEDAYEFLYNDEQFRRPTQVQWEEHACRLQEEAERDSVRSPMRDRYLYDEVYNEQ